MTEPSDGQSGGRSGRAASGGSAGAQDSRAMIAEALGVSKQYGEEFAVRDIDLSVPEGSIFGFIGPSGSGKTTTIRLLAGIQQPTAGEITVFGKRPVDFSVTDRRRIGYMPQLSVLYPHLSLQENLNFVASIYGMSLLRRRHLYRVLDFVELQRHRKKLLREASGGMQRRLALAASLIHQPDLLFLDEPTAGIDPVLRRKFWDHFEELKSEGRTLFITTQYVGEAAYCDFIGVLADGRLLMVDTPEGVRRSAMGGELIVAVTDDQIPDEVVEALHNEPLILSAQRNRTDGRGLELLVDEASTAMPRLQQWFSGRELNLESIQHHQPPFDDVFVEIVNSERAGADAG